MKEIIGKYLVLRDVQRDGWPAQELVLRFPDRGDPERGTTLSGFDALTLGEGASLVKMRECVERLLIDLVEEATRPPRGLDAVGESGP